LNKQAVVLFAHGSRDPGWARPFEALAATLREHVDGPVVLAYLELMQPTLGEAIDSIAGSATSVRVVPVFFGPGGHVKEDLPRMVNEAKARHSSMQITIDPPIGNQPAVIKAIAREIAKK
jgi:sirohydrochlorin cobaltochelatase